jgi:uncharacterized membrane protein
LKRIARERYLRGMTTDALAGPESRRPILEFVKTTVLGGLLFLVPVAVVVVLVREVLRMGTRALAPVAHRLPPSVVGFETPYLAVAATLVLVCFAAGLIARTRAAQALTEPLERLILAQVPGYTLLKTAVHGIGGLEAGPADVRVALAWIEEAWVLAFVLEAHASGLFTVFVPSAPTPAVGTVYYLPEDRLRRLDVSVAAALACVMRLGVGSRDLLEGRPRRR